MTAPLDVMKSITGTSWSAGDSATIDTWLDTIGARFPEMAGYCRGAKGSYFPWCGLTVAYCMCRAGIKPVFGATDLRRFLWAEAWLDWGIPVDTPQAGDALVFDFGGGDHHVTLFEADDGNGRWSCRGGNQSHTVDVAHFLSSQCQGIRRPPMTAASNFTDCLKLVLIDEGGNDDNPADPGGRTSRGITQREYDIWRGSHAGLPSDVWQAPDETVAAIYRSSYWDVLSCDSLPLGVNYAVFDYGVNSGVSRAAKVLQGIVGVDADGEVGPDTVVATLKADPVKTINAICDERMAFLHGLGTWGTFGRGWTNRVEGHVRPQALAMVPDGATTQTTLQQPPATPAPETPAMNPDLIGLLGQLTNVLGALQSHLVPPAVTQPAPPVAATPAPAPAPAPAAPIAPASPAAATAPAVNWIRLATDAFALFMAVQASPAAMAALHSIHDNLLRVKSNA